MEGAVSLSRSSLTTSMRSTTLEVQITSLPFGEVPDWLKRPCVVSKPSDRRSLDTPDEPESTTEQSMEGSTPESMDSDST